MESFTPRLICGFNPTGDLYLPDRAMVSGGLSRNWNIKAAKESFIANADGMNTVKVGEPNLELEFQALGHGRTKVIVGKHSTNPIQIDNLLLELTNEEGKVFDFKLSLDPKDEITSLRISDGIGQGDLVYFNNIIKIPAGNYSARIEDVNATDVEELTLQKEKAEPKDPNILKFQSREDIESLHRAA